MTERPSIAGELQRLVADLREDGGRRDGAVVRLRLAGRRALPHLRPLILSDQHPAARAAALDALDGLQDARAADLALAALDDAPNTVAIAALGVLRGWVSDEPGTRVLEAIATVALDTHRPLVVRRAALDALSDLPADIVEPLAARLPPADDTAGPQTPDEAQAWLAAQAQAPLSALHEAIGVLHAREQAATARHRHDWSMVRGAVHLLLARRGSRIALYDLRETLERARAPLPLDFLSALDAIGDTTCLEPLARAWAAAPGETWWRQHLATAGAAIVRREKLTGRHAAVRRIRARWPGFLG